MINDLIILALKVLGVFFLLVLLRALQIHCKVQSTLQRLCAQGITNYPGNSTFLVGPTLSIEQEYQKRLKNREVIPVRLLFALNLLSEGKREPDEPPYNAQKIPMLAQAVIGKVLTHVADPQVIQDIYSTKNKFMNKSPLVYDLFAPMLKKFFGTMESNEDWRVQRKACAPMFYKQKLAMMGEVYK